MIDQAFAVFIIDDDAVVRQSLQLLIAQEGISVQSFDSAESFLEAFEPGLKGCIVTDLRMPDMDGLALQEALIQRNCLLPIIFLTAYGSVPMSVKAMKAGAVDFLIKPVTRAKLLDCIQSAFVECKKLSAKDKNCCEAKSRLSKLTKREKEILQQVVEGCASKEIAADLGISYRTVEIHRSRIMQKTGANGLMDLVDLVHLAQKNDSKSDVFED